jgi:Flp pilus assembly pilin Flp
MKRDSAIRAAVWLKTRGERGQTMAEYAVVLGVVVLAVVGVFTALAGGISGALNSVKGAL